MSMFSSVGPSELIIVLVIALLVLGPKRLPSAAASLGNALREFKSAVTGGKSSDEDKAIETTSKSSAAENG